MITRYTHNALTWVDLHAPTPEEVREVMEEYNIAPELVEDLTAPVPQSRINAARGTLKLTLDFPMVKSERAGAGHEVKFIITKKLLLTVRYEEISAFHKFAKEFEVLSILSRSGKRAHAGHIFVALIGALYARLDEKLDYLNSRMSEIDECIFQGKEKEMVADISEVSRRTIAFNLALSIHKEVLENASPGLEKLFGSTFLKDIDGLMEHFHYLIRRVRSLQETIDELRETNSALLTTKQNEIMKNLTVMAFITFPLMLFTSMFGMNTKILPIVGMPGDFWIIITAMGVATVGFFIFFKYRDWI